MNTYHFEGIARQRGALGARSMFTADVRADTLKAARLKLYDHWEHITVTYAKEHKKEYFKPC